MLKAKRECFRLALEQDCTFYDAVSTGNSVIGIDICIKLSILLYFIMFFVFVH